MGGWGRRATPVFGLGPEVLTSVWGRRNRGGEEKPRAGKEVDLGRDLPLFGNGATPDWGITLKRARGRKKVTGLGAAPKGERQLGF